MFAKHKDKILKYLRAGEEIAYAAGFVRDIINDEYTSIDLVSYADEESEWTSEDIYNFEKHNIVFDSQLFERIVKM
jgi:hypothetical protein